MAPGRPIVQQSTLLTERPVPQLVGYSVSLAFFSLYVRMRQKALQSPPAAPPKPKGE